MLASKLSSSVGTNSASANYIEDVFSTYLYTGNGSSLTVTNNIDLSTKGGLVWCKDRTIAGDNALYDTARGVQRELSSNNTTSSGLNTGGVTAFNTTGFTVGADGNVNANGYPIVSWTFRKQPKFFDVVTYTGNGTAGRTVAHNLGSVPGSIIVKSTSSLTNWHVYHRSLAVNQNLLLDLTQAARTDNSFNSTAPTATEFSLGGGATNTNGQTYVAYLFAHNAGGFGLNGTDNVISCGSFTSDGAGAVSTTLGYEPQWVLYKPSSGTGDWRILDNMRGWAYTSNAALFPNGSYAESVNTDPSTCGVPTATGFSFAGGLSASTTYIYIAIRRGPMKVPTSGTSVFSVDYQGQYTPKPPGHTSGFVTDMALVRNKNTTNDMINVSRLTGDNYLITSSTAAAGSLSFIDFDYMNGWGDLSTTDANYYSWMWRRAPSFFDEVCYTGTGTAQNITHNLGVAPEMMIIKSRSAVSTWIVYAAPLGNTYSLSLNQTTAQSGPSSANWNSTTPTSSVFSLGAGTNVNGNGNTFVAYLFATCAGVSKVGSYTGNAVNYGDTQNINCGFTSGARFVLIKPASTTGNWYVFDTARGIVSSGSDPWLLLNSTAAEGSSNEIEPASNGFTVRQATSGQDLNTSGVTYIYLAIA